MAVLAPTPSAIVATAAMVKTGLRRSVRQANDRSRKSIETFVRELDRQGEDSATASSAFTV
jgi:hypothetical protein